MIEKNISEGLKLAVSKGETLQQAMQSFYNAGYKKEDIESAARLMINSSEMQPAQPQESNIPQKKPILPQQPPLKPAQKVSGYRQQLPQQQCPPPQQPPQQQCPPPPRQVQKVSCYGQQLPQQQCQLPPRQVQKVSGYGQPQKQRNPKKIMVILVIILLIVFGGTIGGIFFFKENLSEFFSSLIG